MTKARKPKPALIGEFEFLVAPYYWARAKILRDEGIGELPFYMLRRAVLEGRIGFTEVRRETGKEKSDITKALKFLLGSDMARLQKKRDDKRRGYLKPLAKGRKDLRRIDGKIRALLVQKIGLADDNELREFVGALEKANSWLVRALGKGRRHYAQDPVQPPGAKNGAAQPSPAPSKAVDYGEEDDDEY